MVLAAISLQFSKGFIHTGKCCSVKKLCGSPLSKFTPVLTAKISGKAYRVPKDKPAPFPYKEKKYTTLRSFFDRTSSRFDENTKLIVVEGPIACGKTDFAKELAEDLGMYHIPEANMDIRYINSYGYDLRQLDDQLPVSVQSFDEKKFCMDPFHINVGGFQMWMYMLRFSLYVDAIAHILSTGQGVVTERSPYSDCVFLEAMVRNKYMSREARDVYYQVKENTIDQLLRPHLIIYLDVPVKGTMDNIKKRNLCHEVNGKALTEKYLTDLDQIYKREFLSGIEPHTDILMYDWTQRGDIEAVVEDLERLDLDSYTKYDKKSRDWIMDKDDDWDLLRMKFADQKADIMSRFNIPLMTAPELLAPGEDIEVLEEVWEKAPGSKYEDGFNKDQGDTGLLFKVKGKKYVAY